VRLGFVGCGNIAGPYAETLRAYPDLRLSGCCDLDAGRAEAFAASHGARAYPSLDALLADPGIEIVVNLTHYDGHAPVTLAAIAAGKHVHSEKPLAMRYADAVEILAAARAKGVQVSCSPITWMGEAQQTFGKVLRSGAIGAPLVAYAEMNHGRIESWHPSPKAFYECGPLYDIGVYPLSTLCAFLGPVRRVSATAATRLPVRTRQDGGTFEISAPDWVAMVLTLESGVVCRVTVNFLVEPANSRQGSAIEVHGERGSARLGMVFKFDADVEVAPLGKPFEPVPRLGTPFAGGWVDWARGLRELADAIREHRPHRGSAELAAHIVETLNAAEASARAGGAPIGVSSSFDPPPPMPWAA
jgi:predicted dehydrogenase